tara:strand:+ start:141 stop:377 length:237 start_codon:yes stop_codon:yes gene_type:complete
MPRKQGRPKSRPDTPEIEEHRKRARERYRENREALSKRTYRLRALRKAIGKISGPTDDLVGGDGVEFDGKMGNMGEDP